MKAADGSEASTARHNERCKERRHGRPILHNGVTLAKSVFERLNEAAATVASVQGRMRAIRERNELYPQELKARIAAVMEGEPARRSRKRSLATVLAAARKAGADRVVIDGAAIVLSPAAAMPESLTDPDAHEWDVVLPEGAHQASARQQLPQPARQAGALF
jgi:hypothetical protein